MVVEGRMGQLVILLAGKNRKTKKISKFTKISKSRKNVKLRASRAKARPKPARIKPAKTRLISAKKAKPKAVARVIKKVKNAANVIVTPAPKEVTRMDPRDIEKVTTILADSYVRQMLIELGGENALAIIRNFYGNHSDEDLAKSLKLKISDVRATLNKLHNEGLVNYLREKDSETGWYSYSWSLNLSRIERWVTMLNSKADAFSNGADYYFCASCGSSSITNFESAANADFRCERCNKMLEFLDEKRISEVIYDKKKQ